MAGWMWGDVGRTKSKKEDEDVVKEKWRFGGFVIWVVL